MAAMYVYNKAFVTKSYGPGQTEAVILFLFTAIIAVSQAVMNKRKEVEA
jgi:raffinose/stachyose/melibiose transport system permease protein